MMRLRSIMGRIYQALGRCYYCGHRKVDHLPQKIRECKHRACDCFGFDAGPVWAER